MIENKSIQSKYVLIFLIGLISCFYFWDGFKHLISWDTFGQYCYLPLAFIEQNFAVPLGYFEKLNKTYEFSNTLYQFNVFENIASTKYTLGLALINLPFFLIGHLFAWLLNFPLDGYSMPYEVAFGIGSLFYTIVGLIYFRKILRHFFNDRIVSIVLVLIVLGTNYFHNATFGRAFTHTFSFTFLSILIWYTIQFHQKINIKNALLVGSSLGILGLIRIPDLLFGLIPLLWNVNIYGSLLKKGIYFIKNYLKEILIIICSFLGFMFLQFIYWKLATGHFVFNSYANNAGEGFDWLNPYIVQFLFSFKKGWLIYTPIGILIVVGLVFLWKKNRNERIFVYAFLLFLFVVSCWTTWWYAGSFSQRPMIDIYVIGGISLGALFSQTRYFKTLISLAALLVVFNLFQTWQFKERIIHASLMNKEYYFATFFQTSPVTEKQKQLLSFDYADYEWIHLDSLLLKPVKTWHYTIENGALSDSNWYTDNILADVGSYQNNEKLFVTTITWLYDPTTFTDMEGLVLNSCLQHKNDIYNWRGAETNSLQYKLDTLKHSVQMNYFLPPIRSKKDKLRVQVWRKDPKDITFKSVKITLSEVLGQKEWQNSAIN